MPVESELIDVAKTFPTLHIDLKYATADNITGQFTRRRCACCIPTRPPRWQKPSALPRWPG